MIWLREAKVTRVLVGLNVLALTSVISYQKLGTLSIVWHEIISCLIFRANHLLQINANGGLFLVSPHPAFWIFMWTNMWYCLVLSMSCCLVYP